MLPRPSSHSPRSPPEGRFCGHDSARRRQWAFLVVVTTLFLYRGLGRSGEWHIESATVPILVFWPLLLFTTLKEFSRRGRQPTGNTLRLAALAGLLLLAWRLPISSTSLPASVRQLREMPAEETQLFAPDPTIGKLVGPGEFLWPVDQGIVNVEQQRPNPTRHAIAFCIGSPNEQRRAVRDLATHRAPVILWDWRAIEEIPGTLRHWMIGTWVLRQYRPVNALLGPYPYPYAVLSDSDWSGEEIVPREFLLPFALRRLPQVWGERRWLALEPHITVSRLLPPWGPEANGFGPQLEDGSTAFVVTEDIVPRQWNYVSLELAFAAPSDKLED